MQALLQTKGIEYVLDLVGSQNKYQMRALGIIILHFIFKIFFVMYYPFLNRSPVFLCKDELGQEYECNENNGGCVDRILSPNSPNSLVSDLGFYCEGAYVRTLASIFFFVGGYIGQAYFSYVSDNKGRKTSMFQLYFLGSVSTLLLALAAVGPATYVLFIMTIRAGMSCHSSISFTYLTEISNQKFAKKGTLLVLLIGACAAMLIAAIAYFIPSWKTLLLWFIALPSLAMLFTFVLLDETPVFFFSRKDLTGTINSLRKIARVNNKAIVENELLADLDSFKGPKTATSSVIQLEHVRNWNYIQILLHPSLRQRVLTFGIVKLYLCMAFYGCLFALSSLGGSLYVNIIIAAVAEAIGTVASYLCRSYPVRVLLKRCMQTVVLCGLGFLFVPVLTCDNHFYCSSAFLQGFLALAMRIAVCFVYGFIYNLGNEIFPPEVRSQSIGISEMFSVMGGIIAPIVILCAEIYQVNALFLFGSLGFIALFASQYVPSSPMTSLEEKSHKNSEDVEMDYIRMKDKESL